MSSFSPQSKLRCVQFKSKSNRKAKHTKKLVESKFWGLFPISLSFRNTRLLCQLILIPISGSQERKGSNIPRRSEHIWEKVDGLENRRPHMENVCTSHILLKPHGHILLKPSVKTLHFSVKNIKACSEYRHYWVPTCTGKLEDAIKGCRFPSRTTFWEKIANLHFQSKHLHKRMLSLC